MVYVKGSYIQERVNVNNQNQTVRVPIPKGLSEEEERRYVSNVRNRLEDLQGKKVRGGVTQAINRTIGTNVELINRERRSKARSVQGRKQIEQESKFKSTDLNKNPVGRTSTTIKDYQGNPITTTEFDYISEEGTRERARQQFRGQGNYFLDNNDLAGFVRARTGQQAEIRIPRGQKRQRQQQQFGESSLSLYEQDKGRRTTRVRTPEQEELERIRQIEESERLVNRDREIINTFEFQGRRTMFGDFARGLFEGRRIGGSRVLDVSYADIDPRESVTVLPVTAEVNGEKKTLYREVSSAEVFGIVTGDYIQLRAEGKILTKAITGIGGKFVKVKENIGVPFIDTEITGTGSVINQFGKVGTKVSTAVTESTIPIIRNIEIKIPGTRFKTRFSLNKNINVGLETRTFTGGGQKTSSGVLEIAETEYRGAITRGGRSQRVSGQVVTGSTPEKTSREIIKQIIPGGESYDILGQSFKTRASSTKAGKVTSRSIEVFNPNQKTISVNELGGLRVPGQANVQRIYGEQARTTRGISQSEVLTSKFRTLNRNLDKVTDTGINTGTRNLVRGTGSKTTSRTTTQRLTGSNPVTAVEDVVQKRIEQQTKTTSKVTDTVGKTSTGTRNLIQSPTRAREIVTGQADTKTSARTGQRTSNVFSSSQSGITVPSLKTPSLNLVTGGYNSRITQNRGLTQDSRVNTGIRTRTGINTQRDILTRSDVLNDIIPSTQRGIKNNLRVIRPTDTRDLLSGLISQRIIDQNVNTRIDIPTGTARGKTPSLTGLGLGVPFTLNADSLLTGERKRKRKTRRRRTASLSSLLLGIESKGKPKEEQKGFFLGFEQRPIIL